MSGAESNPPTPTSSRLISSGGSPSRRSSSRRSSSHRSSSPDGSVEVSSPEPHGNRQRCESGNPCADCREYWRMKEAAARRASVARRKRSSSVRTKSSTSSGEVGADSAPNDSLTLSTSLSVSLFPCGKETSSWGGVDQETELRCRHGDPPRRLYVWKGKHTGRRFYGCAQDKDGNCGFIKWIDQAWPPRAQQVISSLWKRVGQYIEQADQNQVEAMGAMAMRNEVYEEKESLILEKEDLEREKALLLKEKEELQQKIREQDRETRFAHTVCRGLQARVANEVREKAKLWVLVSVLAFGYTTSTSCWALCRHVEVQVQPDLW